MILLRMTLGAISKKPLLWWEVRAATHSHRHSPCGSSVFPYGGLESIKAVGWAQGGDWKGRIFPQKLSNNIYLIQTTSGIEGTWGIKNCFLINEREELQPEEVREPSQTQDTGLLLCHVSSDPHWLLDVLGTCMAPILSVLGHRGISARTEIQ